MRRNVPSVSTLLCSSLALVWACSGSSEQSGTHEQGAASGQAGSLAGVGGGAGAGAGGAVAGQSGSGGAAGSLSGASGSGTGGASGAGASGGMASGTGGVSGSSDGGAAGSAVSGASGSSGSAGSSDGGGSGAGGSATSTACAVDDDCVVAATYSSTGCCSRGCGFALNGEWVANEPCATADPIADPVPPSCNTGCSMCPAGDPRCPVSYGAVCRGGTCTLVTPNGPCATDADCVIAVDYQSTSGACCDCTLGASKETLAHNPCIVEVGQPKPAGCEPTPVGVCDTVGCPTCGQPTTRCIDGVCGG